MTELKTNSTEENDNKATGSIEAVSEEQAEKNSTFDKEKQRNP